MNGRGSYDRCVNVAMMILMAAAAGAPVMADVPYGGATLITPYEDVAQPSVAQVEEARRRACECRCIEGARVRDSRVPLFGQRVGFLPTKAKAQEIVKGKPSFSLTLHQSGGKSRAIALSDVQSFKVLKTKDRFLWLFGKEKAQLEVVLFPTITPEALVETTLSFTELKRDYTTTVVGWLYLREKGNAPLCLVAEDDGVYRVLARIKDLELNRDILFDNRFDNNALWWAVGSVIKDSAYPYRRMMSQD